MSEEAANVQSERLDELCINTLRTLSMDMVEQARSGHPGMPMGAAAMAYVLWTRFLKHDPADPSWPDRDRFVLSAGHGCALLYCLLHLTGYDLPLDELQRFRQWGSRTPGHPERGLTPGVEATTGPLGQGFANGVGMAIAERLLAQQFNRPGHSIVDHYTYGIVSDGDLMEGVASEAASLAEHLRLCKLIYLYDDNRVTIEGPTALTFSEDVAMRFAAYGWHVQRVDGNNLQEVDAALRAARAQTERPSLIIARTHIAYGSPHKQDSSDAHGAALGEEEVRLTKSALGWPPDARFYVPEDARAHFRRALDAGRTAQAEWRVRVDEHARAHPDLAAQWRRRMLGELPEGWESHLPAFDPSTLVATREASGKVIRALAPHIPELLGGSADLAPSNETYMPGLGDLSAANPAGRNLRFGVREHAMGAILNGLAAHGGLRPFGGTLLVFSDYMRPAIRLAALMKLPVVYVFTHDSIGLGEDGPTHQPVEHLAALRAIPNLTVLRPADAAEAAEAWRSALAFKSGPVALVLSRQKLPVIDRGKHAGASGLARGAYVLAEASGGRPDLILLATGSEVSLALEARAELERQGTSTRVVSMPSWELFEAQTREYRDAVLPPAVVARLAIEAASPQGWCRYVGAAGDVLAVNGFGASAPGKVVLENYGFTVAEVVRRSTQVLRGG
jgi:transketolase